jgi:hypothetical protein
MAGRRTTKTAATEAERRRRDERHQRLCYLAHQAALAQTHGTELVIRTASGLRERRGRIVSRDRTGEAHVDVVARGGSSVVLILSPEQEPLRLEDVHSIEPAG